jgi:Ca2+-binding EF-hand superfamily protein
LQRKHDAGLPDKFVEALSSYDDGNGVVNTMELRNLLALKGVCVCVCVRYLISVQMIHCLTIAGEPLTEKELNQLLAGQEDSAGNVNISELVRMIMQ